MELTVHPMLATCVAETQVECENPPVFQIHIAVKMAETARRTIIHLSMDLLKDLKRVLLWCGVEER